MYLYACQYKLVWRLSEFAFFMRLLRWAHFLMKGYSKMVEEIINELKNSNAKLGKTVDFGCENVNIILDKGKMWIKKPCNGKIMVHFVKEYETEEEVLTFIKALDKCL